MSGKRETKKAKVKATQKEIVVYQHVSRATWIDAANTSDEYQEIQLVFLT